MGQTSIIETTVEDVFNADDGVVIASTKRAVKKTKLELTDQFVKVSKYLNVIFSYNKSFWIIYTVTDTYNSADNDHYDQNFQYFNQQIKTQLSWNVLLLCNLLQI